MNTNEISLRRVVIEKVKSLFELLKFKLSLLVAASGAFGFALAAGKTDLFKLLLFVLITLMVTGAANIVNQIKEIESDKLMKRTQNRPLPTARVSIFEAAWLSAVLLVGALLLLGLFFNWRALLLALVSFLLYGFLYTPLKKTGPVAVFVGAFPGAFPPMIGWVAATNHFGLEPGILFAIQFFWQFPHFWAIAWVLNDDYSKAGFKLLPAQGEKDIQTAVQIMIWTLFLLPLSWVPFKLGMTGVNSAIVAMVCGILFLAQTFYLVSEQTDKAARRMMFGSFVYLPVVQIAFLLDKV